MQVHPARVPTRPTTTHRRVIAAQLIKEEVGRHPPAVPLVRPPRLVEVREQHVEHISRRRRRRRTGRVLGPPAGLHLGDVRHKVVPRRPHRRHQRAAREVGKRVAARRHHVGGQPEEHPGGSPHLGRTGCTRVEEVVHDAEGELGHQVVHVDGRACGGKRVEAVQPPRGRRPVRRCRRRRRVRRPPTELRVDDPQHRFGGRHAR